MPWIASDIDIGTNTNTLRLQRAMEWDMQRTVGALHMFWHWAMHEVLDGDLRKFNDDDIAIHSGVALEDAEQFVNAMKHARYIEITPYFRISNWWEIAGKYLRESKWRNKQDLVKALHESYANATLQDKTRVLKPFGGGGVGEGVLITPVNVDNRTGKTQQIGEILQNLNILKKD